MLHLVELCWHGIHFCFDQRARFVHEVDGLIRKKAVRNITVRENRGSHQRIVFNLHAVVYLVALLQATQDGNALLYRRCIRHHRLETALQCCILLNILAVLIQRCRADAVELASCQHGL